MTFILQYSYGKRLYNSCLPWRDHDGKFTDQYSCIAVPWPYIAVALRIFWCSSCTVTLLIKHILIDYWLIEAWPLMRYMNITLRYLLGIQKCSVFSKHCYANVGFNIALTQTRRSDWRSSDTLRLIHWLLWYWPDLVRPELSSLDWLLWYWPDLARPELSSLDWLLWYWPDLARSIRTIQRWRSSTPIVQCCFMQWYNYGICRIMLVLTVELFDDRSTWCEFYSCSDVRVGMRLCVRVGMRLWP